MVLFSEMATTRVPSDVVVYNTLISACEEGSQSEAWSHNNSVMHSLGDSARLRIHTWVLEYSADPSLGKDSQGGC